MLAMPWMVVFACGDASISTKPLFGAEFQTDLDGDGQREDILVDYEQVRIGTILTTLPKIQIHRPPVHVIDLDQDDPDKELVIQAVDASGVGVWHVLLYVGGQVELYSIEVSNPPKILGDGVLRTHFTSCGETLVTDWARSEGKMTQTRTERIGIYNAALCSG